MAVNRVDFGGNTLIDLTGDTLELPEQLLKGIIAHCKDGTPIEGTLEAGGGAKVATGTIITNGALSGRYVISALDFIPTFAAIIRSEVPSTRYVMIGSISDSNAKSRFYCAYSTSSASYFKMTAHGLNNVLVGFLLYTNGKLEYYNGTTSSFMDGTYTWVAIG